LVAFLNFTFAIYDSMYSFLIFKSYYLFLAYIKRKSISLESFSGSSSYKSK